MGSDTPVYFSITYPNFPCTNRPYVIEHNGKLFCAKEGGVSILSSPDGLRWSQVGGGVSAPGTFLQPRLASFNRLLWCVYLGDGNKVSFMTSNDDGESWTVPSFTNDPGVDLGPGALHFFDVRVHTSTSTAVKSLYLALGYGLSSFKAGGTTKYYLPLTFKYTSDGKTWQDGNVSEKIDNHNELVMIGGGSLTTFNNSLYCSVMALQLPFQPSSSTLILELDDSSNEFSLLTTFGESVVAPSLFNLEGTLWMTFEADKCIAFQTSTDGSSWSAGQAFPDYYSANGTTGIAFNNNLFITNGKSNFLGDNGQFNVLTDASMDSMIASTYIGEIYKLTDTLDLFTFCPRIKVEAFSAYIAIGEGSDGNYYLASFSTDGSFNPYYASIEDKPTGLIANKGKSWLSFSAGAHVYVFPPGEIWNWTRMEAGAGLFTPVLGPKQLNHVLVQAPPQSGSNRSVLTVCKVHGERKHLALTGATHHLSPCGTIRPTSNGQYLYVYNETDDIFEVYDMTAETYGTPLCSSSAVGFSSLPSGTIIHQDANDTHMWFTYPENIVFKTIILDYYKAGDTSLEWTPVNIEVVIPFPLG